MNASCPRRSATTRSAGAFTLIELLVVISIIALLIGILLPALGAARASARTVQCLSNIRQMNMAVLNYATDNKDELPSTATDLNGDGAIDSWFDARMIGYYLPDSGVSGTASIDGFAFVCPGDDQSVRTYSYNTYAASDAKKLLGGAGYNGSSGAVWDLNAGDQTQLILFGENWGRFGAPPTLFSNATMGGVAGTKPGQRFGSDNFTFDNAAFYGPVNTATANNNFTLHGGNEDISVAEAPPTGRSRTATQRLPSRRSCTTPRPASPRTSSSGRRPTATLSPEPALAASPPDCRVRGVAVPSWMR